MTIEVGSNYGCGPCDTCGNPCNICSGNAVPETVTLTMSGWIDTYADVETDCALLPTNELISVSSDLNTSIVCDLVPEWSSPSNSACCVSYYGEMTYGEFYYSNDSLCPATPAYDNEDNWARGSYIIGFKITFSYVDGVDILYNVETLKVAPGDATPDADCELGTGETSDFFLGGQMDGAFLCDGGDSDEVLDSAVGGTHNSELLSYEAPDPDLGPFAWTGGMIQPTSVIFTAAGSTTL